MAAAVTVSQLDSSGKSHISKSGVLAVHGFGVRIRMQSGHLEIEDGIGPERRRVRLPRVGHGLKRLVCIAENGFVTLDALKWLGDQKASFSMLDRSGKVFLVTGPTTSSDARLRRAQALARHDGVALEIMRELMAAKLRGQRELVRSKLNCPTAADAIENMLAPLSSAESLDRVAHCESQAAAAYWSAWTTLPIGFPRQDASRVPAHWLTFGTRKSLITGSQRLATNPPNAILNYCYALLESETRLAASTLGLDPAIGMLHVDTPARDSLACDIMEAVRPSIDAWLLDWIMREPFRRSDFFEQPNGNCRILKSLTTKLSETAPTWGRLVAPWAEYVARTLWSASRTRELAPTHLTQRHRREAKGSVSILTIKMPKPNRICRGCGKILREGRTHCASCAIDTATERLMDAAQQGRLAAHSSAARLKAGETQRRHADARSLWRLRKQSSEMTEAEYAEKVQPLLTTISTSLIARTIGVSRAYAGQIRKGYRPHARHWGTLSKLVGTQRTIQPYQ